jgi:uncharacterized protein (DUF433 family)
VPPTEPQLLAFFSERDITRLTGLSRRRLRKWDDLGIFRPANRRFDRDAPVALYDFRDVVGLRALAKFSARLPVERLREIGQYLAQHSDRPWSQLKFHVSGNEVLFIHPGDGKLTSTSPLGQLANAEWVNLSDVAELAKNDVIRFRQRGSDLRGSVIHSRDIQRNQPIIAGTRIPTEAVWSFRESGYTTEQIIAEYPSLTPEDVDAAIAFEAKRRVA